MSAPSGEPAPSVTPPPPAETRTRRYQQKLWVPVVLVIGLILGEVISLTTTVQQPPFYFGGGPPFFFHNFPTSPLFQYHIILTTVEVALLIALVVIYGKMYLETKANFALGLVVVLFALLVQALLAYPIVDSIFGTPTIEPGFSSWGADVFAVCAYTLFLYLSLE